MRLAVFGLLVSVGGVWGQQANLREVMAAAAERQRAAVAQGMSGSIAKQRASVRAQVKVETDDEFFVLPGIRQELGSVADGMVSSAAMFGNGSGADCDALSREEAGSLVARNAIPMGLEPGLIHAVIAEESAYRPCAISRAGALGLMQLMPATADHLGVKDPLDPAQNVEAGTRYLKELMDRYGGNAILALAAYNAGPARVDAAGGLPAITETGRYVDQVLKRVFAERKME